MFKSYYPVPRNQLKKIKDIDLLGMRNFKVILHSGYCFKDIGCHAYIIERGLLFSSFDNITECVCSDCIIKRVPGT